MLNIFNIFNISRSEQAFTILARYANGSWFKSFTVSAPTAYEACRLFDTSDCREWVRVSGASLKSEYRNY